MISQRISDILQRGSAIRKAFQEAETLRAQYGAEQVFDLSLGNPSAPVPDTVQKAIHTVAETELDHSYMADAGYLWVRSRIAESLKSRMDVPYDADHILLTCGAAGALNVALSALLDPGDEVIVLCPYYPAYRNFISNWQGVMMAVPCDDSFCPDLPALERAVSPRTKAVILNSPNNPSGVIYSQALARRLTSILLEKQREYGSTIFLISDEPYRELVYDGSSLPVWAKLYPNSIMAYSFSKTLSVPGERIGYLALSPQAEESRILMQAFRTTTGMLGYVNAPAFFQRVIGMCLETSVDLQYYARNRDTLYQALLHLGFEVTQPQGAFYLFVHAPDGDEEHFLQLARKHHLVFVGGSAFGCPGYVRLSFCGKHEMLERALPALALLALDCNISRTEE